MTLSEFVWPEMSQRFIGSSLTLADSPSTERGLSLVIRLELHDVQTVIAQTIIEGLDVPDFYALPESNEAKFQSAFQALGNALRGCRAGGLQQRDCATQLGDSGKAAILLRSEQLIVHETDAPALAQRARHGHLVAVQPHFLALADARPKPQPIEPVESPIAHLVKRPVPRAQHHMDQFVAEPQSCTGNPASS